MDINNFKQDTINLFRFIIKLDPTAKRDEQLNISKQDYKILEAFYKLYNMENIVDYSSFIYIIKQQAVAFNMIPTEIAEVICKKLGIVNG